MRSEIRNLSRSPGLPARRSVLASCLLFAALHALPAVANTYTVSNTNDDGPGSLRQAIKDANSNMGADTIWLKIGSGAQTISPLSPLPDITEAVLIDGWVQPGFTHAPLIRIDGNFAGANVNGLRIYAGPTTVRGVMFTRFTGYGVEVGDGDSITFTGCYFGTTGITAGLGNGDGMRLYQGTNITLGGTGANDPNVISGNVGRGIYVDPMVSGLTLKGNRIGTTATGMAALANGSEGVRSFASHLTIGGATAAERNLFSGNGGTGLSIDSVSDVISIKGNYFGLDIGGSVLLANGGGGLAEYGTNAIVGGSNAGEGNVAAGNGFNGMLIGGDTASVQGNRIGTNSAGTGPVGNGAAGLRISGKNVTVGGATAGAGNLISANSFGGIAIEDTASGTILQGNIIGLDASGTIDLGNTGSGIVDAGSGTQIGGTNAGEGNVISGNSNEGLYLLGVDTVVVGNRIGTNSAGTAAKANDGDGIDVYGDDITIGGPTAGARNLISGNTYAAVAIDDGASGINVYGNYIGVDAAGTAALANGGGINTYGTNVQIGGSAIGSGNVISGNTHDGIYVGAGSGVSIRRNYIGTDPTGQSAIGNGGYALRGDGAPGTLLGTAGNGNVMSGNGRGVVLGYDASGYIVRGNIIGVNKDATMPLGNGQFGLDIGTPNNVIGGTTLGAFNIISGNTLTYGIFLEGPKATNNVIADNYIGTNPALAANLGNLFGIVVYGAHDNTIGGTTAGTGNYIAYNANSGIDVALGVHNRLAQNSIFGNGGQGIDLDIPGIALNDALDEDHGANDLQNYPIVKQATAGANTVTVAGTLGSKSALQYRIEYFVSTTCDAQGFGEGEHYIGFQNVTTDAAGNATLAMPLSTTFTSGYVTATATDPENNTSEFSPCITIGAPSPGEINISAPVLAYEDVQSVKVGITRTKGVTGAVSVRVKTSDDSAKAPADYGAIDQIVTFADGEVLKYITLPIVLDAETEGTEHFNIELSQITGGALYGANATVSAYLFDHDADAPFYSADDIGIAPPFSGTKVAYVPLRLSAPTNHTVTLTWVTEDAGGATPDVDYVPANGSAVFNPGDTVKLVPVTIKANGPLPADRVLFVRINGATGNVIAFDGQGQVTIFGGDRIFANSFD